MLAGILRLHKYSMGLLSSQLYDEKTFFTAFISYLSKSQSEVVIESPFITGNRIASLLLIFSKMRSRSIKIIINTRHPDEHDTPYDMLAQEAIAKLQDVGVEVLYTGRLHRKLAVFDRRVLWEGSLNILSQNDSCEIMRRIESENLALQMIKFLRIDKYLLE